MIASLQGSAGAMAIALPIALMYLLMIVRFIERRLGDSTDGPLFKLSVRDSAMATLALDISELVGILEQYLIGRIQLEPPSEVNTPYVLAFVLSLTLIHAASLVADSRLQPSQKGQGHGRESVWPRMLGTYWALGLLMSNAVTMRAVVEALGSAGR